MKVKTRKEGQETVVTFSGDLNEHAEAALAKLAPELSGPVAFEWGGVKTINSLGAGFWIEFLNALGAVPTIRIVHAPVGFVTYANAVEPFLGRAKIWSLEVPMYCAKCDDSVRTVVDARNVSAAVPLKGRCEGCKGPTEPEIEWSSYISFLNR